MPLLHVRWVWVHSRAATATACHPGRQITTAHCYNVLICHHAGGVQQPQDLHGLLQLPG
jgi:hypothetical protein